MMTSTVVRLIVLPFLVLVSISGLQSCAEEDLTEEDTQLIVKEQEDSLIEEIDFIPEGIVEVVNEDKVEENYILVNDIGSNRVYLMNKEARLLHEWTFTNNLGNDVFLLPNGKLLASLESDDPVIKLGGKGGRLQIVAPDGDVEWDFTHSSREGETHHDAEMLPNGNIIVLVWERLGSEQAVQAGFMLNHDVFPESIIEINPATNEIVWEWHSWNHLVQDHDETKANYDMVSEHPERIDINYVPKTETTARAKGDIMHANAIVYDKVNDVVLLSVNFYSEVWAIDHSTSTEEAAGQSGGNYNKGGDLIYRFGNPETYRNSAGTRLFYNNHFPNLLQGKDEGKLLIFSNGNGFDQSTVFELELPCVYDLQANSNNEPKVTWSFTDSALYAEKVSGAVPLPNGNILITEGDFGFWEVTRAKEVVWKCSSDGFFWRGYQYSKDAPEISDLGL